LPRRQGRRRLAALKRGAVRRATPRLARVRRRQAAMFAFAERCAALARWALQTMALEFRCSPPPSRLATSALQRLEQRARALPSAAIFAVAILSAAVAE